MIKLFIFGLVSTIQANTNSLFGLLFGAEANTKRIFSTALVTKYYFCCICKSWEPFIECLCFLYDFIRCYSVEQSM